MWREDVSVTSTTRAVTTALVAKRCWLLSLLLLVVGACQPQPPTIAPTLMMLPSPTRFVMPLPTPRPTLTDTPSPTPSPTITPVPPTPSPTITETPTVSPTYASDLELDFDRVFALDFPLRAPVRRALREHRYALPRVDALTVSAVRLRTDWAKITLVPTTIIEERWQQIEQQPEAIVEVIAQRNAADEWLAYVIGTPAFDEIAPQVPADFATFPAVPPPLAGEYRFPWREGRLWWAIQGWHGGNALDFQPPPYLNSYGVLASEAGYLREICRDGFQSLLQLSHGDGRQTYYLHVQPGPRARQLLDQPIVRGQYLGELIRIVPFNRACGFGNSRHLHFMVSDRDMTIEGYTLEEIAATASCCRAAPGYISHNTLVID